MSRAATRDRERLRYVIGAGATGFPLAVPVDLVVSDEEHQVAALPRVALMDVPMDRGARAVSKLKEEVRRQLEGRKPQAVPGGAGADESEVAMMFNREETHHGD